MPEPLKSMLTLALGSGKISLLYRVRENIWITADEFERDEATLDFKLRSLAQFARALSPGNPATKILLAREHVFLEAVYPDSQKLHSLTSEQLRDFISFSTSYDPESHELDWRKGQGVVEAAYVSRRQLNRLASLVDKYWFYPATFFYCSPATPGAHEFHFRSGSDVPGPVPYYCGRETQPFRLREAPPE